MNRVLDHLYIGGVSDLLLPLAAGDPSIYLIVRLYTPREDYPKIPVGVIVADYPIDDGGVITPEWFSRVTAGIQSCILSGQSVVVMCAAGKSRSATVILAYLCTYGGMTPLQAWKHLKTCRPIVDPNIDLVASLMKFLGVHPYLSTLIGD